MEARLEHLRDDYRDLIVFGFAGAVAAGFALRNPAMGVSMAILVAAFTLIKHIRNKRELPQVEQELNELRTYLQRLDRDAL